MDIGIALPALAPSEGPPANLVDTAIEQAREAHQLGISSVWLGQRFDYDAIALAGLIGREVPGLRVGTSAVPILGRHPLLVGAQAATAQAASHGHFELGIALGAKEFMAPRLGPVQGSQITRLREFLTALRPLLDSGEVDFAGELITASTPWPSPLPGARPAPPVLVAAMGPKALRVTGELADGTLPYLAGPKTLAGHIVPTLNEAAHAAGRPTPRVVTLISGVVTSDAEQVREQAYQDLAFYQSIPSYRAVLDREGVAKAGELAVIGSADEVLTEIGTYVEAGATEIVFSQTAMAGPDDRRRTWEVLGSLR
jgi:F420-dependent oxidoreductase-like protein